MIIFTIPLILLGVSYFYDPQILTFFSTMRIPFLTVIFRALTELGSFIFIPALILSIYLWKRKKNNIIIPLWISLIGSFIISWLLKEIIQRPRPMIAALIQETGYAFPSSHATVAFALLPFLDQDLPQWKAVWWSLAIGIAVSRMYLGVHYASDIIAGALLGYGIGMLCLSSTTQKILNKILFKVV